MILREVDARRLSMGQDHRCGDRRRRTRGNPVFAAIVEKSRVPCGSFFFNQAFRANSDVRFERVRISGAPKTRGPAVGNSRTEIRDHRTVTGR